MLSSITKTSKVLAVRQIFLSYYEKARYKKNPLTIKIISGSTACLHLLRTFEKIDTERKKSDLYISLSELKTPTIKRGVDHEGVSNFLLE